jgi:soluble lytic murein transglycosylase-like protein
MMVPILAQAKEKPQQFLRGHQYIQQQQYGEVIDLWAPSIEMAQWGPLEDYVFYYLGQAYEGLNLCEKGYEFYHKLVQQHDKSRFYWPAYKGMGTQSLCLGKTEEARKFFNTYLKQAPSSKEKTEVRFLLALSYDNPKTREQYKAQLKKMWETEADNRWVKLAYELLNEGGVVLKASDYQVRAHNLLKKKQYTQALPLYLKHGEGKYRGDIGECYYKLRKYTEAKNIFERDYKRGVQRAEALGRLATIAVRLGNDAEGIKLNQKVLQHFPQASHVNNARRKLAFLYRDGFQFEKAIHELEILLASHPSQKWKKHYLKSIAWNYYRLGGPGNLLAYEKSIQYWEDLIRLSSKDGKYLAQARYWQGRIYEKLGKDEEARKNFRHLITDFPWTYYGFLALKALSPQEPQYRRAFKAWQQKRLETVEAIPKAKKIASYGYHYPRFLLLSELQLEVEAQEELLAAQRELRGALELSTLVAVAHDAANKDDFYFPFRVGISLWNSHESMDVSLLHWAYPQAYFKEVKVEGKKQGFDPYLMYAVMRQESHFRPKIVSWAGARGLLQIMPATGKRLAKKIKWPRYDPDDLFDPKKNITLSGVYLKILLGDFDRDLVSVLASYNAGENAVKRWKKNREHLLPEEFAEEIPYEETNHYVKKVLENYWIYRSLYKKDSSPNFTWRDGAISLP